MKGSVLVLLGCFALFAAPSRSHSTTEGEQLTNRRDAPVVTSSPSTTTSGDGVEETETSTGGSTTTEMDGDESFAGGAQAEKSEIRKRDTRGLVGDEAVTEVTTTTAPPIDKESALLLFEHLGKLSGKCFEQGLDYINAHETAAGGTEPRHRGALFTRSSMIEWLDRMKDYLSECLMNSIDQLSSNSGGTPDSVLSGSDTFANVAEFLSPLKDFGECLIKCLEDAIGSLEATSHGPGDTVERSSDSSPGFLAELIETLGLFDGLGDSAGNTAPAFTTTTEPPYDDDSPPVIHTPKRTISQVKPRGYRHYSNLPSPILSQFVNNKNIPSSIERQFSRFRGGEAPAPHVPVPQVTAVTQEVDSRPTRQPSLLAIVLGKIYSELHEHMSSAMNSKPSPERLRADANGAFGLYGRGGSPAMRNPAFHPDCVSKRMLRNTGGRG